MFQAFPDGYVWRYGEDRPFWPSRARIADVPWEQQLRNGLLSQFKEEEQQRLLASLANTIDKDAGPLERMRREASAMDLAPERQARFDEMLAAAGESLLREGALKPSPLLGSETCGSGGCHDDIYKEWVPSAHGFAAFDPLFLDVQEALAESGGPADTRACAGCHDPVTLLSGKRDGGSISGDNLTMKEGVSCLVCHGIV